MTHTIKAVLLAACLTSLSPVLAAAEGGAEGEVAAVEGRYITNDEKDGLGVFIAQLLTHWLLVLQAILFIVGLFAPAFMARSLSWEWSQLLPAAPDGLETGLLERALNSIDPVEATFSLLQVQDPDCRRRVVCEVQRSASALPLIGAFLQQLSTSIHGLHEYREAQQAGADLQDCTLLFSQCPSDTVTQDYYNY